MADWNTGRRLGLWLMFGGTSVVGCKRGVDLGVRRMGSITVLAEGVNKVGED